MLKFVYTAILFAVWYVASAIGIAIMVYLAIKMLGIVGEEITWILDQLNL
jgi:hypothetical protein